MLRSFKREEYSKLKYTVPVRVIEIPEIRRNSARIPAETRKFGIPVKLFFNFSGSFSGFLIIKSKFNIQAILLISLIPPNLRNLNTGTVDRSN
jgi:hypothetical protein